MGIGMEINQDGNGNDPYSHGNLFPSTAEVNCYKIQPCDRPTRLIQYLRRMFISFFYNVLLTEHERMKQNWHNSVLQFSADLVCFHINC